MLDYNPDMKSGFFIWAHGGGAVFGVAAFATRQYSRDQEMVSLFCAQWRANGTL